MKCNKSLISALLFCALALTLPAGNADLLTNGSFENGLDGWRVNNVGGADATAEPDQQASDGKQSLKIRFGKERRKNVYITVWRSLKVQPWSSYRLSFKAKTRNSKPFWAGMEYRPAIYVKDGNSDWKEYSFEFKSEQRTSVHFRFLVDNTAEGIWLDDVKLEKIPNVSPEAGMEQSILAFGAKPDGKTDCSSAFRKAIQAGVTQLFLPEGNYALAQEIVLPDGFRLRGCGKNSRIIALPSPRKFVLKGGSNSRFSDFTVDAGQQKTHGLYFLRAENIVVERVFISNTKAFGINFDHINHAQISNCTIRSAHTGIMQTYCSNIRTMQNTVLDCTKHGIQFWSQDKWRPQFRTRNLWFCNNYVKNAPSGDGGIWGVGVIGVVMSGNIVERAMDVGLDLEWCENAVISGNIVRDTEHGGISLFFSCKNITITGNTVYNDRIYSKAPGGYWVRAGIWLTYPNIKTFKEDYGHENITIAGNTIINGPGPRRAIWIGCGKNILIQGNNLNTATIHHGGEHGNLKTVIKEYSGEKDYRIDSNGEMKER